MRKLVYLLPFLGVMMGCATTGSRQRRPPCQRFCSSVLHVAESEVLYQDTEYGCVCGEVIRRVQTVDSR